MFNDFLKSIKGERRLSYNHWRYLLLHWCFSVKDPQKSTLPNFLYTHYCPLFHLTNLLAISLPLIVVIKLFIAIVWLIGFVCHAIIRIFEWLIKTLLFRKATADCSESVFRKKRSKKERKALLEQEKVYFVQCISTRELTKENFRSWFCISDFVYLKESYAEQLLDEYLPKIEEAKKTRQARLEKFQAEMVFWVNFSRLFFKCGLNLCYIALAVAMAHFCFHYGVPIFIGTIKLCFAIAAALYNLDWITIMGVIGLVVKAIVGAAVVYCGIMLMFRLKLGKVILPPFSLLFCIFKTLGEFVGRQISGVAEFIGMFYEENCPPIIIVNDTDAIIAEIETT